jgi:hypothetical protein
MGNDDGERQARVLERNLEVVRVGFAGVKQGGGAVLLAHVER